MSEILVDDAWDLEAVVLADMPFAAYYPLEVGEPTPPAPPVPPAPSQVGGGVSFRRLPFWPAPPVTGEARVEAPPARVRGRLRADPDELGGEENRLLGLL